MPSFSGVFVGGTNVTLDASGMAEVGPVIPCEIRVPKARADWLVRQKAQVPQAIRGEILIDTGAATTCIDEAALKQLGLLHVAETRMSTPSGEAPAKVYVCGVAFPGSNMPSIDSLQVLGVDIRRQNLIGLIGRDLLSRGILVYNGGMGYWSFSLM